MQHTLRTFGLFVLAGLFFMANGNADPITVVYKMPSNLVARLKAETEQRDRGECEQKKRELISSTFYALSPNKLLILIGIPDYFCHASSFMPVTVDSQGYWQIGTVLESYPSVLLLDESQGLWLVSHWEHEAVFPFLHYSTNGLNWQEINLPKSRQVDCCFEWLKQVCVTDSTVQLKFAGMNDARVEYWQTTINESLKITPRWRKSLLQKIKKTQHCQTVPLGVEDWQRRPAPNGTEIWFYSVKQAFSVVIPRWLELQ